MNTKIGNTERMTSVSDHEPTKARARQAKHVVRYCKIMPEARDEAIRTSSVSLQKKRFEYIEKKCDHRVLT